MVLGDERLRLAGFQLGDYSPAVAALDDALVRMLHPDNGNAFAACAVDEATDGRDHGVAFVCARDDVVLHVDDQQCAVGSVLECRHRA